MPITGKRPVVDYRGLASLLRSRGSLKQACPLNPITAKGIEATREALIIALEGRTVSIPWERCSKRLAAARDEERLRAELSPGGYGIHWPLIDEDLSIGGLVRDSAHPSM